MSDDPIYSSSFSNGDTSILIEAMPGEQFCLACERDDGPLKQVAYWGDRDTVFWLINELYGVLKAMDRATEREAEAA